MDLSRVVEIFGTLSVGIFVCIGFAYLWWLIKNDDKTFFTRLKSQDKKLSESSKIAISIAILAVFTIGIIVRDLTDYLVDKDKEYRKKSILFLFYWQITLLKKEGYHRFKSLIKEKKSKSGIEYELTDLGENLSNHKNAPNHNGYLDSTATTKYEKNFLEEQEKKLKKGSDFKKLRQLSNLKELEDFVNKLYYRAKNWVYSQENYYDELRSIQRRIDFTRSMYFLCTWFLQILIIFIMIGVIKFIFYIECKRNFNIINYIKKCIPGLIILFVLSCITLKGYHCSESMFNERAFGYYISYLDDYHLHKNTSY